MNRVGSRLVVIFCSVVLGGAGAAGAAGSPASTSAAPPSACRAPARVAPRVLPVWARGGFSDPKPRMPHVLGRAGRIAAILWANPLRSPPAKDHNNKILWVARAPATGPGFRISAQRMSGSMPIGAPVTRRFTGGPGPSIVDLPAAGCWRLTLRWSRSVDSLDLRYLANRAPKPGTRDQPWPIRSSSAIVAAHSSIACQSR